MTIVDKSVQRGVALSRQVHAALVESIATGKMLPSERVVVERVAQELGVSPTPVREAINRLIQEGLIEDDLNGRFHVVGLTPDYVIGTYMVSAALEGLAAELAAPRISDEHLVALRQALADAEGVIERGEYELFTSRNTSLHQIICDAAGNSVLSRELRTLRIHIGLVFAYANGIDSREQLAEYDQRSHEEHIRVVESLAGRDPRAARELMERHVRDAGVRCANLIDLGHEYPGIASREGASGSDLLKSRSSRVN